MATDPKQGDPLVEPSPKKRRALVLLTSLMLLGYIYGASTTSLEGAHVQIATTKKAMAFIASEESYNEAFQNVVNCKGSDPCGIGTFASQRAAIFMQYARESGADAYAPKN